MTVAWWKRAALAAAVACALLSAAAVRAQPEDEADEGADEAGFGADSPVAVLTESSFDDAVHNLAKAVLVEFYAPWCGHCKALKPVYEAAAEQLKETGLDGRLAAIDATEARDVATKYEVGGFPTLQLFKRGKMVGEYRGARSPEAIVAFVESHLLPAVVEIKSQAEFDRLAAGGSQAFAYGHFTTPENEAAQTAFVDAAKKVKELEGYAGVRFGLIKSGEVAAAQGMLGTPALKMTRALVEEEGGEPKEVEFDFFTERGFNEEMVREWIVASAFPNLAEVTADNYGTYERRGLPFAWCFVPGHGSGAEEGVENTPAEAAAQKAAVQKVREVAERFAGKISFVWLSGEDYADHAGTLGVDAESVPAMVVQEMEGEGSGQGKRFLFEQSGEQFDVEAAAAWVQKYLDGGVAPHVRSEPVPEDDGSSSVQTVVASTFDELVYENDNDVLIEFYAPWCGHCKALEPVYEELATALASVKGITLAKIDATANDVPPQIEGFPTIYFKKGSDKEHRLDPANFYEGGRTKEDFIKFLKENSSADLDDMVLPADLDRITEFMNGFDSFKDEVKRLVAENKELQKTLDELTGVPPAEEGAEEGDEEGDPFADSDMIEDDDSAGHDEL